MKEVSLKKNVVLSTMYQILLLIAPLLTAPYVSRILGADGIGIYSYTQSIVLYFTMFAALGTASYGTREIALVRNDKEKRSKIFWEIEILSVITSSICIAIWICLIIFNQSYKIYFLILTLSIINTMLDISWFYAGMEQFKYTIRQNAIFKILSIISIFIFVKEKNDLTIYILIVTLSTLLGTASMWIYLPKYIKKVSLKKIKLKKHFKETLVYFIPTIATSIYTVLDKTLIGLITKDNNENGYYEQATKIINICKSLTFTALNTVLGSRISYLYAQKKYDEIKERINQSMDYILFIGIGIMFGLIGVSSRFVPLFFGDGYEEVILVLKFMSPLIVIIGISNCLGSQYFTPAGLRKKSAQYIIVGSLINLIFNLILIPKLKSYGAVIASILAELVITILYVTNSQKIIGFKEILLTLYKKVIAGLMMLIVILFFDKFIISNVIALIVEFVLGLFTYLAVLKILNDSFINFILAKMKKIYKER